MTDLVSSAAGGRIVSCNDEFFAEAANLLEPSQPEWREGVYTDRGKWMDGWETRRRREPGHDWCVIALGIPGRLEEVTVDTSYFTGNYAEEFSLDGCGVGSDHLLGEATWVELIPKTGLAGDSVATFMVDDPHRVTHLRLNIYPDGGVARLRVEGTPIPSHEQVCPDGSHPDLASSLVGGRALAASDTHYSSPSNLLRPSEPAGMWDGWETKRRRGPGHDWATFALGLPGSVESIEVDTRHFKGNSPGWVSFHVSPDGEGWVPVVAEVPVGPDTVNLIPLAEPSHAVFVRLDIHPDGGLARLRVRGAPDPEGAEAQRLTYLNALFQPDAAAFFRAACDAGRWVEEMTARRPYAGLGEVIESAEAVFATLDEADWLEAFASHPRIGERGDAVSDREQAGVSAAAGDTLAALAEANRRYEERYGFTYIVYASGKTADEMLSLARERLLHDRDEEILNASEQQRRITETRLRRMLCAGGTP